jgi:endonuclease/exonuclease/phosphatase family metal-dependent hydrolase
MEEKQFTKGWSRVKQSLLLLLILSFSASASLRISSYNIRNYDKKSEQTDKAALKKIITNLNSDLIATEEIYNNNSFEQFASKEFPGYGLSLSKCGGGGSQNLGFMYKKDTLELENIIEDPKIADLGGITSYGCSSLRPALLGFFKVKDSGLKFVAIVLHLKAGGGTRNYEKRERQYKYILKMMRNLRVAGHKNIVVLGDLNTTGWNKSSAKSTDLDHLNFEDLLAKSGTRTITDNLKCTSYWSGPNRHDDIEIPSTLDHVLFSPDFMGMKLESAEVGSHCKAVNCVETYDSELGKSYSNVSDHCPITATFK